MVWPRQCRTLLPKDAIVQTGESTILLQDECGRVPRIRTVGEGQECVRHFVFSTISVG
jgi:hypothetical protein